MAELRELLHDAAGPQPGLDPARVLRRVEHRRTRRRAAGALAAVVVMAGVVALAVARTTGVGDEGETVVAGEPVADGTTVEPNPVDWRTPYVSLRAEDFAIDVRGRTYTAHPTALDPGGWDATSDPGRPEEYTTFEATWHEHGTEMRLFIYFHGDGTDWWSDEIRIYDGDAPRGEWIIFTGEHVRRPLGEPFVGDLDLADPATGARVRVHGLELRPFLAPSGPSATTVERPGPHAAGTLLDGRMFVVTREDADTVCVHIEFVELGCTVLPRFGDGRHAPKSAAHPVVGPVPEEDAAHLLFGIAPEGTDEVVLAFADGRPFEGEVLLVAEGLWVAPVEYGAIPTRVSYLRGGTALLGPLDLHG